MSETNGFEPKIVAYVCNWCTYLGADLAGTNRLEYPPNVRLIRLPCTGRIDFNLIVKAFEMSADAVLVSGCHPGDCHYTAGNYHARRRWMLFRPLLEALGFDLRRIHFTWISAAEGRKFQQVIAEITESARKLGPYRPYEANGESKWRPAGLPPPKRRSGDDASLRTTARELLAEGKAGVVIGRGERGPVLARKPEDADRLTWNGASKIALTAYLKRKEVRALGKPAIVAGPADLRALNVLEQESQIRREDIHVIAAEGPGAAPPDFSDLDALLQLEPGERMAYWAGEFDRCVKCYACRQACPLCYCERCIVDKNRPQAIDTSAHARGNFAWHITRAFHLAGRCVGCGACTRACPAGIDLRLLNQAAARAAERQFGYRAGADPKAEPLVGVYSLTDKEEFIG
ncbi:MAG: hydrogenase iron-sulfur subunit [Bryobacteraceae bacterium]|nr:hydrogenase iron-sulfur subunit [Bryobacteraceae bacterium]